MRKAFGLGAGLFYLGIAVGYFIVMPVLLVFFNGDQVSGSVENTFALTSYISIFMAMVFVMGILFALLFRFTTLGLYIQTVGINQGAARLNGINAIGIKLLAFILLGACCSVAGMIGVSRLSLINHETLLLNIEMDAILAVAIGGNSLGGGKFKMVGSVLGAYAIQALTITLYAMKVPSTDVKAYKAVVIVLLVVMGSPVVKEKVSGLMKKRSGGVRAAIRKGVG